MKKALLAAAAIVALPVAAQAQAPQPGIYIGAEGGINWLTNFTANTNIPAFPTVSVTPQLGWMAGGVIGYDFVGPRVELEGIYRWNPTNVGVPGTAVNNQVGQLGIMANLMYDFMPGSVITPHIGAGAGLGLVDGNSSLSSTVFAYQGIVGLGWNADTNFRVNPGRPLLRHVEPDRERRGLDEQQLQHHAGPAAQVRFGSVGSAAAAAGRCSAVVHGVLRLGSLEPVGPGPEHDQAGCRRVQVEGQRPHHGDRSHRHVGHRGLQHGAVAASRQRRQGRSGSRRRAGDRDRGGWPWRAGPAGPDRPERPRAAEPPRRDRHPVSWTTPYKEEAALTGRLFLCPFSCGRLKATCGIECGYWDWRAMAEACKGLPGRLWISAVPMR